MLMFSINSNTIILSFVDLILSIKNQYFQLYIQNQYYHLIKDNNKMM